MAYTPYEDGGITGKNKQQALVEALQGTPTEPAAPALSTQYRNQLGGFDTGKLDAQKNDPKYVFAKYAQGLNVQDAADRAKLQGLLQGDSSGFFKNATLDGDILHGAYDPETGRSGDVDVIKGLKAGGEGWQWGAMPESVGKPAMGMTAPTTGMPSFAGSSISPMLQSDAQQNIQQALAQYQQPGLLQSLIAALGGGR